MTNLLGEFYMKLKLKLKSNIIENKNHVNKIHPNFINSTKKKKIFEILEHMQRGNEVHSAFYASIDASPEEIENRWIRKQRRQTTWLIFLAGHIYEILFLAGALLTVIGFIRFLIKKRNYTDEDDD